MNTALYSLTPIDYDPFSIGEIERIVPPAETQQEIWLSCAIGGRDASCSYNESISLKLEGTLDAAILHQALHEVIQRHEALRYAFSADGKKIHVTAHRLTKFNYKDIAAQTDAAQKQFLDEFGNRDAAEPFDLGNGPLFRAFLFKLAEDVHLLRLTAHHIICDGWSFGIILEELSEFYLSALAGRQPALPEVVPMSQYNREMESYANSDGYQQTLRYWLDKFQEIPPPLTLPTDRLRPEERTYKSRRDDFVLDTALVQGIKQLGASNGLSLVNTLLISFEVYLSCLTGQSDVVVGLPTAGQAATGHFNLVGHCVNLLPIRSSIVSSMSFVEHLRCRKSQLLDDYDHQLFTFGTLLKSLKIKRDSSRVPLVPIVFNIDMGMDTNVSFPGIKHTLISNPRTFENFEIFLNLTGSRDTFVLEWSYNTHLFEAETIKKMMDDFEGLLSTVIQIPSTPIGKLRIANAQHVVEGPAPAVPSIQAYPKETPFFKLISEAAQRTPVKSAVRFGSQRLSYTELDERSNQFAHYLRQQGITQGDVVGIAVDRSAALVVALLGIAKSGAAYLPLDPEYPIERITYMLDDSGAKLLISNQKYIGSFASQAQKISLETLERESLDMPLHAPENHIKGGDLAYILYTSGSTGKPKGVEIEHHSLTNFLHSMQRAPGITAEDRLLAITTISFDIAGLELYLPLISGAELILADKESARDARALMKLIDTEQVTMMQATPATWRMLVNAGWSTKKSLKALCGGESFPKALAERLLQLSGEVWNMYGPTETTIWSTIKQLHAHELNAITVGAPIANTSVYILDEELNPVAHGETGQLFIGGEGVARGYHGRPDLTRERFVPDLSDSSKRMYATGDLCRVAENGEIICLGRMDHQVKIRGYRIELGEIEHQLSKQPGVKETVVIAREDTPGDQRLVAYVIPEAVSEPTEQSVTWKDKWDNIYHQGINSEADLDLAEQNLDVAIVEQLGNQADDLKEQTAEWLSSSIDRIKRLAPKRIFEVGSGAGQVMFELVAGSKQYIATDYAESAIKKLQEKIAASPDTLGHVRAHVAPADDFSCLNGLKPDLVLVHSVAQYFPDMDYLVKVIGEAADHMDQGCIFLGDIQGKNTLPIHHTADQLHRTKDTATITDFKKIIANRLRLEDELTVDPAFFYRLPELVPQVTGVDVQLRRGKFVNEITKYHYDVWLYINGNQEQAACVHRETWQSIEQTERLLRQHRGGTIAIQGIPNLRTVRDLTIMARLQELRDSDTVSMLKERVEQPAGQENVDPDVLWDMASRNGYQAHVRWSTDGTDGTFEAVFIAKSNQQLLPPPPESIDKRASIRDFIRVPGENVHTVGKDKWSEWKSNLRQSLPDYMIPNDWVVLDRFPLTDNNKIDRKALPKPERQLVDEQAAGEQSLTAHEELVADIWSKVLKIDKIQPEDDFFELGGHSLLAVELVTRVEKSYGVSLPLTSVFKHSVLADFAKLLVVHTTEKTVEEQVIELPVSRSIPIVESQKEIWLSCMIGGNEANLAYNQSFSLRMEGHFDESAFLRAIEHVITRHEALRVTVDEAGEHLTVAANIVAPVTFENLTELESKDEKDIRFKDDIQRLLATPFDLNSGPLFNVIIHGHAPELHYVTLIIHHIICDATSMSVLLSDIRSSYNAFVSGKQPTLPVPSQLSDYATTYTKFTQSEAYETVQQFWLSQYRDHVPSLNLPVDYPRPIERTYNGDHQTFSLDHAYYTMLKQISKRVGMSMGATLTALVELFLYHRTGQEDIVLGITSAGQYLTGHTDMVGHCVNLLPMRSNIDPGQTITEYLLSRKNYIYDAYEHQQLTFSELLRKLNMKRDKGQVPLVPFVLTVQMSGENNVHFEGLHTQYISNPRASHTFEILLNLSVDNETQNVGCYWAYNTQLFESRTIERMMDELTLIIRSASDAPDVAVRESLPFPNPFPEYVDYTCEYPKDATLLDLFAGEVKRRPDAIAVQFANRNLTYRTLDDQSRQLANYLNNKAPNAPLIPIFIQPSPEMIVGILGVLKSGKAYVPIDPEFPQQRISHILGACASPVVISDKESATLLHSMKTDQDTCLLDDPSERCWATDVSLNTDGLPKPNDDAYVIYTSGSTGVPKGVVITHRSLVDYFVGLRQHIPVWDRCQSYALGSSIATDLGNTVLFGALISGAVLHVFRKEQFNDARYIKDYFGKHPIDCLKIVPSHWKYLSEASEGLFPKKLLIFGGELLPGHFIKTIANDAPDCTIVNHYGPTETTIGKLLHVADKNRDYGVSVPIGKPFSNTTALVLNADMKFCPIGIPGELYIGGDGVSTGYYNNPTLTEKVFLPNPIEASRHPIIYKTGDLVRWNADGEIEYLGRNDDQVKIRGNRIELSEVQHAVSSLTTVSEAAILARPHGENEKRLISYLVPTPDFNSTDAIKMLKSLLPDYMIPRVWIEMERLPRLLNGKIDKKALPPVVEKFEQEEAIVNEPSTKTARIIAEIWRKTLRVNKINADDDFFELGGHSLIAVKVTALVSTELDISVPFSSVFTFPKLSDFAKYVKNEIAKLAALSNVASHEEDVEINNDQLTYTPITEPQQEIWLACEMGGEKANKAYTLSHTMVFDGQLDLPAMNRAVQCLIAKHDSLRAVFSEDGQTMVIHSAIDANLIYEDISHMEISEKEIYVKDFEAINRDQPFDLETGPLVRFALIGIAPERHQFFFFTHHIVCDGWSMRVILKDLSEMYSAFTENIDYDNDQAPSFGAYAQLLHERLTGPAYIKNIAFWKELLTPLPPPLELPLDHVRPKKRTYNSRYEVYRISNDLSEGVKKLGKDANCSLAITLRVAVETFLYRLTNQADLIVGLPITGQITENLDNLVGHGVFLLPARARLHANESFVTNLKTRKNEILRAYDHYSITFGSLIRELAIPRDESRIPLIPVVLNIHMDDLGNHMDFRGLTANNLGNSDHQTFNGFEISLSIINTEDGMKIEWLYNHDLFNKDTIDSFQERFEFMLSAIVANPMSSLSDIPLVDQEQLWTTLKNWNNTYEPYDKNKTLHKLISECASSSPDKVALSYHDHRITYRELEEESNRIARYLIEQGVKVGDPIGVALDRSIGMITTLIAIMKTGGTYLPFEISHPKSRTTYILKETSAKYLITSSTHRSGFSPEIPILLAEDINRESRQLSSEVIRDIDVSGEDLLYILHTSGSTGQPKGVKIRHRNVVNFLMGMQKRPGIQPDDKLLSITPISFDMAVLMYLPLVCGAELVIADDESSKDGRLLHELMLKRKISWMIATPATWQMVIDSGWEESRQLLAISAGEALSIDLAEKLIARCSSVWNGYGPTETTVMVLMKELKSIDDPITLGVPINNTSIFIVDKDNQLAGIGQEGEILIGGDGVGAGYHNLPGLTRKSFIEAPLFIKESGIFYRTGDLGKFLPNGEVLYLGRNDHQVKIRGHRIELGEIEQTLLQIKEIKSAVVKPFGDTPDNTTLMGYIILEDAEQMMQGSSNRQADGYTFSYNRPDEAIINVWRAYLGERLPDYMVPHEFLYLTEFPLTENGKVDSKKLPAPLRQVTNGEQNEADFPTSTTEIKLVGIWNNLLNIEKVGIHDNFFHLGGHSLMAVKMMIQMEKEIGERLPISALIEAPTIRKLSQLIDQKSQHVNWQSLVPIRPTGKKPPLYVVHGIGLNVLFFQNAIRYLDPEQPVFALQAKGLDGAPRTYQTIEEIAADYNQEILQHNPDGPYTLSGYSYGGIIAVEMGRQLKDMGKEVIFIGLFDTYINKTVRQLLEGDRRELFKYRLKNALTMPILFLKNPGLYAKSQYFYVRAKMRFFIRRIFTDIKFSDEPSLQFRLLRKQHMRALNTYTLSPYKGAITLFRSTDKTSYIPYFETNGWQPYCLGGLNVVKIPGSHAQLFLEPTVGILAERLQEQLDESYERHLSKKMQQFN